MAETVRIIGQGCELRNGLIGWLIRMSLAHIMSMYVCTYILILLGRDCVYLRDKGSEVSLKAYFCGSGYVCNMSVTVEV
jgi:hypothetical protein